MAPFANTTGQSPARDSQMTTPSGAQSTRLCSSLGSILADESALISGTQLEIRALHAAPDRALAGLPFPRGQQLRPGRTRSAVQACHADLGQRIPAPPQRIDDLQHTLAIVAQRKYVAAGREGRPG